MSYENQSTSSEGISRRTFLKSLGALFLLGMVESDCLSNPEDSLLPEITSPEQVPVLITGFQPYDGHPHNSSADLVSEIALKSSETKFIQNNLPVNRMDYHEAVDGVLESILEGDLAYQFSRGGIVVMIGEDAMESSYARIEQVARVPSEGLLGIADELYAQIEEQIVFYFELLGLEVGEAVTLSGHRNKVGFFVCGTSFRRLLEFSKNNPERKILPLFIHVPRRAESGAVYLETSMIIDIVEQVMRKYFFEHQYDTPFPQFVHKIPEKP